MSTIQALSEHQMLALESRSTLIKKKNTESKEIIDRDFIV